MDESLTSTDLSFARISVLEDDIVLLEFAEGTEIDITRAKEIFYARKALPLAGKQMLLVDLRTHPKPDHDARAYGNSEAVRSITTAMAILTDSLLSVILGNFFIGINRPDYPTKLFKCPEKAIEWLKEHE